MYALRRSSWLLCGDGPKEQKWLPERKLGVNPSTAIGGGEGPVSGCGSQDRRKGADRDKGHLERLTAMEAWLEGRG